MKKISKTKPSAILILGAPGSGKGTQGAILGTIPRFYHCACGDVFRTLDTRTQLGQKFVEYSAKGQLVPDELTVQLWASQLANMTDLHDYKPDIDILVLDGIPRNVAQAEMLAEYVEIHQVFHLSCPDRDELARRMRKRALKSNRIDDASDAVIEKRIRTYEAETKPILEYYPDEIIFDIDATQSPAKVLYDILRKILKVDAYLEVADRV
ncbi:MAG: adenylate kinase family protein [Verrucomicrobiales bacterium]